MKCLIKEFAIYGLICVALFALLAGVCMVPGLSEALQCGVPGR